MTSQDFKKIRLPDLPGVYLFTKGVEILYIGKASSLRDRVASYFSQDLLKTRSPLIYEMVEKAKSISFVTTQSILEALILESNLIKKHKPIFNTKLKDDKSFNYVIFTNEKYPAVLKIRGKDLYEGRVLGGRPLKIFGPFPNGRELEEALKIIRKIIPFRDDKCKPLKNEPCFNFQIGLCPGICIGKLTISEYLLNLKKIELIFDGQIHKLVLSLEKEMRALAKQKKFELAGDVRNQIFALNHIKDVALIRDQTIDQEFRGEDIFCFKRMEVYDISHLSGKEVRGGMAVFHEGEPAKNEYRLFKISERAGFDDLLSLREILSRRLAHIDWRVPDLIVVDGGRSQLKVAEMVVLASGLKIPAVSVLKDEKHKPSEILGGIDLTDKEKQIIFLADIEAHRFVISKHRNALRRRLV